jgi:Flp pilus assembly pilin Flp
MADRKTDWMHWLTGIGFLLALIAVALLAGCAGTLEKSISSCFIHAGKPAYTTEGTFTKFECR